ncbi:hypothetical protein BGZ83_007778 [Gryganskiella cystojenkinii]|nr:hypothetical protein BGZ83_007778 [Gryganskiella cystojenkinii]
MPGPIAAHVQYADNVPEDFEYFTRARDFSKPWRHPMYERPENIPEKYREEYMAWRKIPMDHYEKMDQLLEQEKHQPKPSAPIPAIVYDKSHWIDTVGELDEDLIEKKLFLWENKFTREEFQLQFVQTNEINSKACTVQELSDAHRPMTLSLRSLAEEMQAMTTAATTVGLAGAITLELKQASDRCSRVLDAQQKLDELLETQPDLDHAIVSLARFVEETQTDTIDMIRSWPAVHHSIVDLGECMQQHDLEHHSAAATTALARKKSRRQLYFCNKNNTSGNSQTQSTVVTALAEALPLSLWARYKGISDHWGMQMRHFAMLARIYKKTGMATDRFSMIGSINALICYNDEVVHPTYVKARKSYLTTKSVRSIHQQIDYRNLGVSIPKNNALTTEEDRHAAMSSIRPLFSRLMPLSDCTIMHEGFLQEFISSSPIPWDCDPSKWYSKETVTKHSPKKYRLIVTDSVVYLCEVIHAPETSRNLSRKASETAEKRALWATAHHTLRLVHEPVLVMDTQISSTPDISHPRFGSHNIVMLCFYNETSYILQTQSGEERDAWIKCARALNIEQPKPTRARRLLDAKLAKMPLAPLPGLLKPTPTVTPLANTNAAVNTIIEPSSLEKKKNPVHRAFMSLGKTFNFVGKAMNLSKANIIHTDGLVASRNRTLLATNEKQDNDEENESEEDDDESCNPEGSVFDMSGIPKTDGEAYSRHFQLSRPNIWAVPKIPVDGLMFLPTFCMMELRKKGPFLHDARVILECTRTGNTVEAEFGIGIEDRKDHDRLNCPIFTIHRRCRRNYTTTEGQGLWRMDKKGRKYLAHPPELIDCYGHGFLNPEMSIRFEPELKRIVFLEMYFINLETSERVREFETLFETLMEKFPVSKDNVILRVDRSEAFQVSKKTVRPYSTLPSVEGDEHLEAGREWCPLGRCHIEFRKMSHFPKALCVGFFNPVTCRDHSNGVLLLDSRLSRHMAFEVGPSWIQTLGNTNGYTRISKTEMQLSLWQTHAVYRTRPLYHTIPARSVVKHKSLEIYKIVGPEGKLDAVQAFILKKMNRLCTARSIEETLELASVAFQKDVLEAIIESEPTVSKAVRDRDSGQYHQLELEILEPVLTVSLAGEMMARQVTYLETVPEEDEVESLNGSTATFYPKSKSALLLLQQEQQHEPESVGFQRLDFDASSFGDLVKSGSLSHFMETSKEKNYEGEEMATPSVADLTKFWAKTTSAKAVVVRSMSQFSTLSLSSDQSKTQTLSHATEVVQATRYLRKQQQSESLILSSASLNDNADDKTGVHMEHLMPVSDLKKRWEDIHRFGI